MCPDVPRALVHQRGLARTQERRPRAVADAERRLGEILARVTELDLEVEALSLALGEFSRRYEQTLGAAYDELEAAERLVRRLQLLEDETARLVEAFRSPHRSLDRDPLAGAVAMTPRHARPGPRPWTRPTRPRSRVASVRRPSPRRPWPSNPRRWC